VGFSGDIMDGTDRFGGLKDVENKGMKEPMEFPRVWEGGEVVMREIGNGSAWLWVVVGLLVGWLVELLEDVCWR